MWQVYLCYINVWVLHDSEIHIFKLRCAWRDYFLYFPNFLCVVISYLILCISWDIRTDLVFLNIVGYIVWVSEKRLTMLICGSVISLLHTYFCLLYNYGILLFTKKVFRSIIVNYYINWWPLSILNILILYLYPILVWPYDLGIQ